MQGVRRGTRGRIGKGGICLALIIMMALISLCVQQTGEPGPKDTLPGATATTLPVQVTRTGGTPSITPSPAPTTPSPPETPGNGESAESTMPKRLRAYFSSAYPAAQGKFPLDITAIDSAWLSEEVPGALPVEACARFTTPGVARNFIFWNDTAYPMPGDFNRFIRDAGVRVATADEARGIADLYVKVGEPRGGQAQAQVIVLGSSADIPQLKNPVPAGIARQVQAPAISRAGDGFRVGIFTWAPVGGTVRSWDLAITAEGVVSATSRVIGESVGDALAEVTCIRAGA